jgi:hypothetical protein
MEATLNLVNEFGLPSMLDDLKRTLSRLRTETKTVNEREPPKLERLQKAIAELEQEKTAKHIFCPDEFLQYWQELLAGQRSSLEWRVVRALCWQPKVATDSNFHHYLDQAWPDLNPRALRGLVIACHTMWSKELTSGMVVERVQQRLATYNGKNRTLVRWRGAAAMILGVNGAQEFSKEIIRQTASVTNACKEWQLNEQSAYVSAAMTAAVIEYLSANQSPTAQTQYLMELLRWSKWSAENFKRLMGAVITHEIARLDERWREQLTTFILGDPRLGDPRLHSKNWIGIHEEARKLFIQWLSKGDIVFFFDHVLGSYDPHGRRDFWLRYVGSLVQSRPLLRYDDETRLSNEIRQKRGALASYGRVKGVASSFLLDFGSIIAIEFSTSGAIYFYDRQTFSHIVPEFWQRCEFSEGKLKNQPKAAARIIHRHYWQAEATSILAQHGIRPDK